MAKQLTLEESINVVLDIFMDEIKTGGERIDNLRTWIMFEADAESYPSIAQIDLAIWDKMGDYSESKWHKLFKQRFGYTDEQFLAQQRQMLMASLEPRERSLIDAMSEAIDYEFDFNYEGKILATFYRSTKTKLIVTPNDSYCPRAVCSEAMLARHGFTVAEAEAFFEKVGITLTKRPVQKKIVNINYYD
jgi:hypothetical protein